jgi:iron(III) transport system permease protein
MSAGTVRRSTARVIPSRRLLTAAAGVVAVLALLFFTVLPLLYLLYGASSDTENLAGSRHIDFSHFTALFRDPAFRTNLRHSVSLAATVGIGATVIGVSIAWILLRVRPRGRQLLDGLMVMPFFLSSFLNAVAWGILGNPSTGLLNSWLHTIFGINAHLNVYGFWGLAFVLTISAVPFVYMLASAGLAGLDASLEEASAVCGAPGWRRLTTVTLPMALPSILAGVLFAVIFALEAFAEPLILGLPGRYSTVTTDIYLSINGFPAKYGSASAMAVTVMAMTVVLVFLQNKVMGQRSFVAFSGKSGSAGGEQARAQGRARYLLLIVPIVYIVVCDVLPYIALGITSFQPFASPHITKLTLSSYRFVFGNHDMRASLILSLVVVAISAVISMAWMLVLAYLVRLTKGSVLSRVLRYVATIPIAVPGIVMGLALLWMWLKIPLAVYGTSLLIGLAFVVRYSPYVFMSANSALAQIDVALEESARVAGAGNLRRLRDIIIPLVRPSLVSGGIMFALFSLRDLNTIILLSGPGHNVYSAQLYGLYDNAQIPEVAAAAIFQSAILVLLFVAGRSISRATTSLRNRRTRVSARPRAARAAPAFAGIMHSRSAAVPAGMGNQSGGIHVGE